MANINNITIEGFKNLFVRDFPYLPLWQNGKAYFVDDIVFYEQNFYKSLIDENTTVPTNTNNWQLFNENIDNYISDNDIERAFAEAKINFNPSLFNDNATAEMIFYYLTAHYLVIDLNNAQNPLALGVMGYTQSKSVGSVSESYGIPQWIMNNRILGSYAMTGYGRKYLSIIQPFLVGNIILSKGRIYFG